MLRSFFDIAWDVSASKHPNCILKRRVAAECRLYGLGWTVATDGVVRVAVDEEDLMADWIADIHMELPMDAEGDGASGDGGSELGTRRRWRGMLEVKSSGDGLKRLRDRGPFAMGWHRRRSSSAATESTDESVDLEDDPDPTGILGEGGGRLEVVVEEGDSGSETSGSLMSREEALERVNGASAVGKLKENEGKEVKSQGEIGFLWMGFGDGSDSGSGSGIRDSGSVYGTPVTTPGSTVGSRVALMG